MSERNVHHELHISVWHSLVNPDHDEFLGQFSLPLSDMAANDVVENWYPLLPKPDGILSDKVRLSMVGIMHRTRTSLEKIKYPPRVLVMALHRSVSSGIGKLIGSRRPHKFVDTKAPGMTFCAHCCNVLWPGRVFQHCKECRVSVHLRCATVVANNCGDVPTVRTRIKHVESMVLPLSCYEPMLRLLEKNNFALTQCVSNERDTVAAGLVRIFDHRGNVLDFLCALVDAEVDAASDVPTLFRANSMASKAIDHYMKLIASAYLKYTLADVIKHIVTKHVPCEIDPTRLDRHDDMKRNWKNLVELNERIVDAIVDSASAVPLLRLL